MKSLKIIQLLAKIGKIFSKIVFICALIGTGSCITCLFCLIFANIGLIEISGITFDNVIGIYPKAVKISIICIAYAINAKFAEIYFTHELEAGTPFSLSGAKELFRLGIITVGVPMSAQITAQLFAGIFTELISETETFDFNCSDSVLLGAMFIVISLLCRYGAEQNATHNS